MLHSRKLSPTTTYVFAAEGGWEGWLRARETFISVTGASFRAMSGSWERLRQPMPGNLPLLPLSRPEPVKFGG
jgi:hypothetical protein